MRSRRVELVVALLATCLLVPAVSSAKAQLSMPVQRQQEAKLSRDVETLPGPPQHDQPLPPRSITLAEAQMLALQNSRILRLASLQISEKRYAATAAGKDYFPKVLGNLAYFKFDDDLGVARTIRTGREVSASIINRNAPLGMLSVAQPISALYEVRQAVRYSNAEAGAAQAQAEFARREISKGVEEAYFALLALQKARGPAAAGVQGAEQLVKTLGGSPEAKVVEVQARQLLSETDYQIQQIQTILNDLMNWPLCTPLVLEDPPPIHCPIDCEADAAAIALQVSPKVYEARQLIVQARAGMNLAKWEYVPNVAALGTYVAQDATDLVQDDFAGAGVMVNHTLFEWGKKGAVLRQRRTEFAMAVANLRKTENDVRMAAIKSYQDFRQAEQTADYTAQIAAYYAKAKLPGEPYQIIELAQHRMKAETAALEAKIALHAKYAALMALLDGPG